MLDAGNLGSGHAEDEVLEQYLLGHLNGPAAEALEEHVLECNLCQERAEAAQTYVLSMKRALANEVAEKPGSSGRFRVLEFVPRSRPVWGAAAALLVLAVGGALEWQKFSPMAKPVVVTLTATRGETASVRAKGPLEVNLDAQDLSAASAYGVQVVNAEGAEVWQQQSVNVRNGYVHLLIQKRLSTGQYFVRLTAASGGTPREYGLQLR